jgi:hypothetical protein
MAKAAVPALPEIIFPPSPDYALRVKDVFKAGWERWYWLQSDAHEDAPDYLEALHRRHLKDAMARSALIIDVGDMVDVVNGRDDKRRSKGGVKPHLNKDDYLDAVVDDVAERHREQADRFLYLGRGNHDLKVLKMCETDILRRVADKLNSWRSPNLPPIFVAGYGGWIRFEFRHASGGRKQSFDVKIFHGSGGGGKVTKGVIQTNRRNAECDADIYVTGHIHEKWNLETMKEGLTQAGRVRIRESCHVQLGSYKLDFDPAHPGTWHEQREGGPKPIGGSFLRFYTPDARRVCWEIRKAEINYDKLY